MTLGFAATALAGDDKIVMKLATVAPKGTPWSDLLKRYKRKVAKATKELPQKIKMRAYLGGAKGGEQSIARQVAKGTLQGGGVSTGALAVLVPDMDILELPYLFDSAKQADKVLDAVRPQIEALLAEKGLKLLMYSENGFRSFGTAFGHVKTPADLKAKKMRAQESEVHLEMYRALGASPVAIAVPEVLPALQTGVVAGFDNTALFIQAASWNQGIKFFTVSEHIYQPAVIIANKKWFDGLPAELQKALTDSATGAAQGKKSLEQKGRRAVRALSKPLLANFEKQGVAVYRHTAAEKAAFKAVLTKTWAKRIAKATPKGKALFEAIKKAKGQ
jgi:TRAP-type C4-dicarboxylate transport system substrate-binding protein